MHGEIALPGKSLIIPKLIYNSVLLDKKDWWSGEEHLEAKKATKESL